MEFIENYLSELKRTIDIISREDIKKATDVIYKAYLDGKNIFVFGNGGSASLASHFACDLGKGTLKRIYDSKEKRFKVISLADNVALLTAFSNDVSYDDIFAQQLNNLIGEGDVVIAITGSGNSRNIINAVKLSKEFGAKTISFTGFNGGIIKDLSDYNIHIPASHYGRVEDLHMTLVHIICDYLTEMKKNEGSVSGQGRGSK